jgi:hypothetical protein
MAALYRMRSALPTLLGTVFLAACGDAPPPATQVDTVPHVYLEALQEAEALRHTMEERQIEQRRLDVLLGRESNGDNQAN